MTDVLSIGSRIYVGTLEDQLLCLDPQTGRVEWSFDPKTPTDPSVRTSGPAADSRRVYFAGGDGTVHALDALSGEQVWKKSLGSRPTTSVLLHAGKLYVGTAASRLIRLDPGSGTVDAELALSEIPLSNPAASGDSLLFFHGEQGVAAVDASLRGVRWKQRLGAPLSSARPYVWRDTVLVGDEHGGLSSLRVSDGAVHWSETFPGIVRGIGLSERTLYVGTLKGVVYAWDPTPRP